MSGRREQAAEMRSTWMVMREPQQSYPSRKQRRANLSVALAESRRATRAREAAERRRVLTMGPEPIADGAAQVPMRE